MIVRSNNDKDFKDNYFTHNRKLKLEEYDDDGNLIDVVELSQSDLWEFYQLKNNGHNDITVARKKDREYFRGKESELMKKMLYLYNDYYFDENVVQDIEKIFKTYTVEQIEFALNFKNYYYNESQLNFSMEDYYEIKRMKFIDVLNWIKETEGIYYAVSNDGVKGMAYFEKPTKKQAKYQRQRNGKRIVFLSFKDWKEYLIDENTLK